MLNSVFLSLFFGLIMLFASGADVGAQSPTTSTTQQDRAPFEPAECTFEFPVFSFISPQTFGFECGYVTVPVRHQAPDGPTIRLAVAILPSAAENPAADPLFLAQGGPGGSSLEIFPFLMAFQGEAINAKRDVVIFDQRGTLYSEPNLICTEIIDLSRDTIELQLSEEEEIQRTLTAYEACGERLTAEGIDLVAFNSLENAADIEVVRQALGYEKINFYGVSYGTLLGLHYMRLYPESLRSVILDAVVPAQGSFLNGIALSADRAFKEVDQLCQSDSACSTAYPDVEDVVYEVMDRFNDMPVTVPVTDPESGRVYQAVVDGDLFINIMFQAMYSAPLLPALPAVAYNVRDGNYDALSVLLPFLLFQDTFSHGMYQTVVCAEESNFDPDEMPTTGVRPQLAQLMQRDNQLLLTICQLWHIPFLGPAVNEPVVSEVPTLLLSGRFDPITPPSFAKAAAGTLSNSFPFTFPTTSHGSAFGDSRCADQILLDFLDDPRRSPNTNCLAFEPTAFDIPTPATVIMTPALYNVAQIFEGQHLLSTGILGVSLLLMFSIVLIWPLLFLIRKITKLPTKTKQPHLAIGCAAPGLVLLMAGLSLLFLAGLFGALIFSQESVLFIGVARSAMPLFLLPPLLLLITLGMVVMAGMIWLGRYWSIVRRFYYSLLTISALLIVGVLANWGMFTIFL